jgi:phytanoyl-CoA hydroxylase
MKLAKKILNFPIFRKKLDTTPLWIDCLEADNKIKLIKEQWIIDAIQSLRENGFAVLKDNISASVCDELIADFKSYVSTREDAVKYVDEYNLYDRLASFHLVSQPAQKIMTNDRTLQLLRTIFDEDVSVVGSLYFDKGSTQDIHRDSPAFFTNPLNHYLGVWTALEDIQENSGALQYYVGGHKQLPDATLFFQNYDEKTYFKKIIEACEKLGLPKVDYYAKKGDTLIWHPQLPHGGGPRLDRSQTRRSIVFHFKGISCPIYGPADFFSTEKKLPPRFHRMLNIKGVPVLDHVYPKFYRNRQEGNFDEF